MVSQGVHRERHGSQRERGGDRNLPQETTTVSYGTDDEPTALNGAYDYVDAIGYDGLGEPLQYTFDNGGKPGYLRYTYDDQTKATNTINRRLVTFQKAGVSQVPYRMATPEEAAHEAWKFTANSGGDSILIRGSGEVWQR